jgi:hypothetical protein
MSRAFKCLLFPRFGESALPDPVIEGAWIWDDDSQHLWDDGTQAIWDTGLPATPGSDLEMKWEDGEVMEWEDGQTMFWEPYTGEVDATPDQFTFATITGALENTTYTSGSITISGVSGTVLFNGVDIPIGIAAEVTGGQWSINGGPWTEADGSVYLGDVVRLRMTTSGSPDTDASTTFTAGGTSAVWTVRTAPSALDTTPDSFTFTDVVDSPLSTQHISNYVTISGINAPTPLEVVGEAVEYSLNDGSWTGGDAGNVEPPSATGWFASPTGSPTGAGTVGDPWDLESALVNTTDIQPGDTLWLLPGTYVHPDRSPSAKGYEIGLQGGAGNYVTVRPYNNGRVTIDGGLHTIDLTPQHVIIRDLEVIVSENLGDSRVSPITPAQGNSYGALNRPFGGIDLVKGSDIKLINNVIHANAQGVGFWGNVDGDSEMYGNIIYDNGWEAPDRMHGHGIYSQNGTAINPATWWKYIRDNVLINNWSLAYQCYGSTAARVDMYEVARNIHKMGPNSDDGHALVGGEFPSTTIRCYDNVGDRSFQIGYAINGNDDLIATGHRIWADFAPQPAWTNATLGDNWEWQQEWAKPRRDGIEEEIPASPFVFLNVNAYDSGRANLAIMNFDLDAEVDVDFSGFLNSGESFQLLDPENFYGGPVFSGVYQGSPIAIPTGGEAFPVFVVMQGVTDTPGPAATVNSGDTLRLRMTSRSSYDATRSAIVTVGDVFDTWTITTEAAPVPDTTPDAFTFTDQTDAAVSTVYTSNSITVAGINAPATVTITGGEYSKNGGAWTSAAGSANLGDQFRVRHTSSAAFSTATNTALTIGGVSDTFTTTTAADPGTDATTPLASPAWLVEAEDYTETKLGAAYSTSTYETIFQWDIDGVGTVTTVSNSSQLVAAINAAKFDTSIKGVHLNPGSYTWPAELLNGLHRDLDDAFFIRTTPGAQSQAVVSKILEQTGNFSGIAFVDLDISGGGLHLQGPFSAGPNVAHDVLIERCHGWIVLQGQRISGNPGLPITNIQVRLNTLVDHWAAPGNNLTHGLFCYNTDWILQEGNIYDHNGWDPAFDRSRSPDLGGPTTQKHNVYFARPNVPEHTIVRFNWNSRSAANGFHQKGGATCYRNIMSCNPIHFSPGYGGDGMFSLYGVVDGSTIRDNLIINFDDSAPGQPKGVAIWLTCIDNALVDGNYIVFDQTSVSNSAAVYLERTYPITATVSNNVAYAIHADYLHRGNPTYVPSITDTGNTFSAASISAPAQALAYQLGAEPTGDTANPVHASVHAWIDNFKTSRRRLGVDIEQLKTWMSTIIGGITP